ncbi:Imm2 family immunity protein [Serratia sp. TSA_198.1]|jgi:hypothetical protein|uniref:Imm2 family immunity protein n=1 Tax=Serratia sp. TSA_198.1 TaxID=3415664 RepID=UPI004045C022
MEIMTYDEIKNSFGGACYSYCQNKTMVARKHGMGWGENESEQAFAYEALENSFSSPVEGLMLEVITLIMMAGRGTQQADKYHRDIIADILSKNTLDDIIQHVDEDEKKELLYDMSILGVI